MITIPKSAKNVNFIKTGYFLETCIYPFGYNGLFHLLRPPLRAQNVICPTNNNLIMKKA